MPPLFFLINIIMVVISKPVTEALDCASRTHSTKGTQRLKFVKNWTFVNANGLGDDELLKLSASMQTRGVYGAMVAETHRGKGHEELELCNGYLFVGFGCDEPGTKRGVGFVLSPLAQKNWSDAGRTVLYESERVMTLRMANVKKFGAAALLTAGVAYFPHSGYEESVIDDFYDELDRALVKRTSDVVIGVDANADIGRCRDRNSTRAKAVGPHGLHRWNERGGKLADWAVSNGLMVARTFFRKKPSLIPTWFQFGKNKTAHSMDQFLVSTSLFPSVADAARCRHLVDSDHSPVQLKLDSRKPRRAPRAAKRPPKRDFGALRGRGDEAVQLRTEFQTTFLSKHAAATAEPGATSYGAYANALNETVEACVPVADRPRPGWFKLQKERIMAAVEERDDAQMVVTSLAAQGAGGAGGARIEAARGRLKGARVRVAKTVNEAKSEWIETRCDELNGDSDSCGGGAVYWRAASELKHGLQKPKPAAAIRLRKGDGNLATSDKENLEVLGPHYEALYNRASCFDPTVLDLLPERAPITELDEFPSDEKIKSALSKLKAGKSGGNGQPADALKIVGSFPGGFEILKGFVRDFWDSEMAPDEWVTLQLAVLPKKGDLSDPNNLRGIALMEAAPKLVGMLITGVLNEHIVLPDKDLAYQCGFIPERGCPDGQMPVKLGLQKRHQGDLDSWVLFVDLVKAFDTVDRIALDLVLKKLGVPTKLRSLIMALHSNVKIDIKLGGDAVTILNTMGVVQGGTLSPTLFIIFVHAFVLTLDTSGWELPSYRTTEDDKLGIRSMSHLVKKKNANEGEAFAAPYSFYADDSEFVFCGRPDLVYGTVKIRAHFRRWGLEMHVGRGEKPSKTVALFCPGCSRSYEDGDTSKIDFDDGTNVSFVKQFKYLGSYIDSSLKDDFDVDQRISAASQIFGTLRECIFSHKKVSFRAKRAAYVAIVLPTLLYGAETWTLSAAALRKLSSFHARCARSMIHVNLWLTREHRIRTEEVLRRLELESIDTYLYRRVTRWLGHVARMPFDRLPRKFLSAWLRHPRPTSTPKLHYGTHILKTLKRIKVAPGAWYALAQDREEWRSLVNSIRL